MRLLETTDGHTFSLTKDFLSDAEVPAYAILSHTWQAGQEVTFDDLIKDNKNGFSKARASLRRLRPHASKAGYAKLEFCARQAKHDGLHYFWVDTCCINKADPVELQKAINSMFRWYRNAARCYVFLSDVSTATPKGSGEPSAWQSAFNHSRWFTRGWTLQELLAPRVVAFFSKEGRYLGDRLGLKQRIHDITKIPVLALAGAALVEFSVDERLSWAMERQTTYEEDKVYSLLGIFGVHLPPLYGEGYEHAFRRLRKEIAESGMDVVGPDCRAKRVPLSTVPFPRDDDFVARDSLAVIHQLCAKPAARAALVGLGGVGKSQIAIEYTYKVLDESPSLWVFWVHAETQASFRDGYRRIADATKMDGWNDPKVDCMRLVRTWLCDQSNGRWVMIIDNADDASVFFRNTPDSHATDGLDPPLTEPFVNFLPQTSLGSILITSRSRDVAYRLTGAVSSIVEVRPMNDEEAFTLLQKKFSFAVQKDEATTLVRALNAMPLALTQAAAFIERREPRMSISKYIKEFHKSDRDRARLLKGDMGDIRRDGLASNSIITTWHISFKHIREQTPTAARLLSLMSFFDRQGIPESLLQGKYGGTESEEVYFEDDIHTLINFSLVEPNSDGSSFEMHALVQFSTKKWLDLCDDLEYWKEVYVSLINESFPYGRPENWPICQALFPHAQAALDNLPVDADALEVWASVSFKVASYMKEMGESSRAYKLALDAFEVREILLGPDDIETLDSLNSVGVALRDLGRYKEAEIMYRRALEAKKRTLGPDSLDTLTTMLNLATLQDDQGHWTDAEKLLKQLLEAVGKIEVSADGPMTLIILSSLAVTYENLGRWTDAAELQLQVLAVHEKRLGPDHPTARAVKGNLAYTYKQQGRYAEAEELTLQIIKSEESTLGPETELLVSKSRLASIYRAQGRWSDAEKLHLQVMNATLSKLGPDHPDTLYSMNSLARSYWTQGRVKEAEELEVQVLERRKAMFGEEHPSTLDSKINLASTYWSQGLFVQAEALTVEVLEARRAKLGDEHPATLDSKAILASTYRDQGKFADAQQLEELVLRLRTEKLGEDHPTTLGSMGNLAVTCHRQGFTERAFELMEKCYQGHIRVLGSKHPHTVRYKEGLEKWRSEGGHDCQ